MSHFHLLSATVGLDEHFCSTGGFFTTVQFLFSVASCFSSSTARLKQKCLKIFCFLGFKKAQLFRTYKKASSNPYGNLLT